MYYAGFAILFIGCFSIFSGIIGLFKFPNFFTKLHAAGLIDTFGIPISLIGIALMQDDIIQSCKLLVGVILIWVLSPVATHAIIKAGIDTNQSNEIK